MTRLQKKCFVVSGGAHGLLLVVLLAAAAFRPEPSLTEQQVLTLVPFRVLDRAGSGGEPAAAVAPQPPRPESRPAPRETLPQPRETTPQPRLSEPPKAVAKTTPTEPKTTPTEPKKSTAEKPAPEPAPNKHVITPEYTPVTAGKKPAEKSDSSAQARARADASKARSAELASALEELASNVRATGAKSTVVALPGEGGGEAFVGYETAIFNAYYHAWKTPEETTDRLAVADAKIVVSRDGTIVSAEIVSKSGDAAVDRSVQRALDQVKTLPPFPEKAKDTQRSFLIRFNLEAKQSSG
jgi:TonB family protein